MLCASALIRHASFLNWTKKKAKKNDNTSYLQLSLYRLIINNKGTAEASPVVVKVPEASAVRGWQPSGLYHLCRPAFSSHLKEKVGITLPKDEALRINLNIDGVTITSRTHTHQY
jgi:hypothetical protein